MHQTSAFPRTPSRMRRAVVAGGLLFAIMAVAFGAAPAAFAAGASTGELAFHPCDQCHPVTVDENGNPDHPLPIGMEKHQIELEVHDVLGTDEKACLACHDDLTKNPGKLILPDGSLVDITGDVSKVCQTCHMEQYRAWQAGGHGKHAPKCTAAGCHDAHTPSWIYVPALPPFQGTGFEVNAVGTDRVQFKPFAGPPVPTPVVTPLWFTIMSVIGVIACLIIVGSMVLGRSKR